MLFAQNVEFLNIMMAHFKREINDLDILNLHKEKVAGVLFFGLSYIYVQFDLT